MRGNFVDSDDALVIVVVADADADSFEICLAQLLQLLHHCNY